MNLLIHETGRMYIWRTACMRNFLICFRQYTRIRSVECWRKKKKQKKKKHSPSVTFCFIVADAHEKINILVSGLNISFFLCNDVNLNTQDLFMHLEFVMYQLGLLRNMPDFTIRNICISVVFSYIQACPNCLPISKYITKPCLYNFDLFKPHFHIVKLGFTGVCIMFLLKNIDCRYSLELARRGVSNEYQQSIFWADIRKISEFLSENYQFFEVKFSMYMFL